MPIEPTRYRPPSYLKNRYTMMLWSTFRRVAKPSWRLEYFDLSDGDFVVLHTLRQDSPKVAVIAPGLPGGTGSKYIRGMARCLAEEGWDVVAWNFRGCSGEPNRLKRSYHGADHPDLDEIVVRESGRYETLVLIGFSLGANIVLKYLGNPAYSSRSDVAASVAVSPPCDLAQTVEVWGDGPINRLIQIWALRKIRAMAQAKLDRNLIDRDTVDAYREVSTLAQADHFVNAPLNGFEGSADYWTQASSRGELNSIETPTLILTARDDPLLAPTAYPLEEATWSDTVTLELPLHGSHVGFVPRGRKRRYWPETRAIEFLNQHLP